MLAQSVSRPVVLIVGIAVSMVNALVLGAAAIRSLGGPFNNSPFAVVFVALALLGPVTAILLLRRSRQRGASEFESRRRVGRALVGLGVPVLAVSLLLLVI